MYIVAAGNVAELKKFFTDNKIIATIVHDPNLDVVKQYNVSGIPRTFFVDNAGKIAYDSLGWTGSHLEGKFLPVLNKLISE